MQLSVQCWCRIARIADYPPKHCSTGITRGRFAMYRFDYRSPSIIFIVCAALLLALAASAHSLPVSVSQPIRRQVTSTRELCWLTNNSCEFYSHCINSLIQCGQNGFASNFAERWCEAVRLFHSSAGDCSSCLGDPDMVQWVVDHEQCFQQRFYQAVVEEFQAQTPDPPTCLHLERRAFEVMTECYASTSPQLCSMLDHSTETFQSSIAKVADAMHLSQYYGLKSRTVLSEAVKLCEHDSSPAIAESLLSEPLQRRLVFCGAYIVNGAPVTDISKLNTTFLVKIAGKLSKPRYQFSYAGPATDDRCREAVPPSVASNLHFHFVVWRPEANDSLPSNIGEPFPIHSTNINIKFFLYQNVTTELCGDGIRQAGEVCDLGIYNSAYSTSHIFGCTESCVPSAGFECSSNQLELSTCHLQQCGDGRKESGEGCDDGGLSDGDGCSSLCEIEPLFDCFIPYNKTSECQERPPPASTTVQFLQPTSSPAPSVPTPLVTVTSQIDTTPHTTSLPPTITPPRVTSASRTFLPDYYLILTALILVTIVLSPSR